MKLRELQKEDPTAWLKPLDPGRRTTNKCLGVLISIGFYASGHNLTVKNVAERIDKLPTEDEERESSVIEENILTPGELVRAINAAVDPNRVPIALAAYCGLRQAEVLGLQWDDLRHSWASNLLEAGANIADVSRDLGHANVYITLKIYVHAIPKARRGTSDQRATLMAQSGNKMETGGRKIEGLRSAGPSATY